MTVALAGVPDVSDVRLIYSGASQAAFSFRAKSDIGTAIRDKVAAALASPRDEREPPLQYLSFVVDVVAGEGAAALAHAEAANHARQFRQWTVVLPAFSKSNTVPDGLDRTRPADVESQPDSEPRSISTKARRDYGREMRRRFYEKEVGAAAASMSFADSFEEIIGKPPTDPVLPLSLNASMAVIYGDGNGFTKIRDKLGHEGFAREVTKLRSELLAHTLDWFRRGSVGDSKACFARDGKLRLETLLWGGDDLMFVMPAWLAIAFMEGVFELTRGWSIKTPVGGAGEPYELTHSFGIVICHYKTPIRLARQLAHELVDSVKDACRPLNQPDAVGIEVFESLIPPQDSLSAYRDRLYGAAANLPLHLLFPGDGFERLRGQQHVREATLPRSPLYRAVRKARTSVGGLASKDAEIAANKELDDYFKRVRHFSEADPMRTTWQLPELFGQATPKRPAGLQLALLTMLWDYLDPFPNKPLPPFLAAPTEP